MLSYLVMRSENRNAFSQNELISCVFSSFLLAFASRKRSRQLALRTALRLERGEMYSQTARRILSKYCGVDIGAYSYGACFDLQSFNPRTIVGRYVSIGPGVLAFRRNHPTNHLSTHPLFYNSRLGFVSREFVAFHPLEIGADSWIGARAIITPGCSRIGIGSVVGAGSIVTKDVPDFAVVAGAPAKPIRLRFPNSVCDRILASKWWTRPALECLQYLDPMTRPLNECLANHPLLTCYTVDSNNE